MREGRILITGATGFLGGAAARELRAAGHAVLATGRNAVAGERLRREGFDFQSCELGRDPDGVRRLAAGASAVVHCAALTSHWGPERSFREANIAATRHVIDAARESGARLVHVSTPSVLFGFGDSPDLREDAPWPQPPANHYIATKRIAETLVREAADVPFLILRPKALIGPGDRSILPRVLRVAQKGRFPCFSGRDPRLDLTWIGDAARAVRLAVEAPETTFGKTYHISGGQALRLSEAFPLLFDACGLRVRFRPVPLRAALVLAGGLEAVSRLVTGERWEPPLTRYTVGLFAYEQTLDLSAARRDLGYLPQKDIREALVECGHRWREEK